jgi:hypothetical protein
VEYVASSFLRQPSDAPDGKEVMVVPLSAGWGNMLRLTRRHRRRINLNVENEKIEFLLVSFFKSFILYPHNIS